MKLIDRFRAIFAPQKTQSLQTEAAFDRFIRNIHTIPDYDEVLKRVGIRRSDLVQITRDEEIAQCIDTRLDAVLSTPWRLEPNQSRASKFLSQQVAPFFDTLIRASMDATLYGYSVVEIIYSGGDEPGTRATINRIDAKPIEWFEPRRGDNGVEWWANIPGGAEFPLDPRKFIVTVRGGTYRNPFGDSLLARLWWPAFFKREGMIQWNRFLEVFGAPIVVGKVANYNQFVDAMTAQGVKSTVAWQSTGNDESVTTISASSPGEFERLQGAMNSAIQKLILGQTLTSDVGSSGSYAAAKVHNEVRADKRNSDIRQAIGLIQSVIDNLAALNGLQSPEFVMADDTGLEFDRAQRDALLVEKGVLKLTKEYILDRYDYREGDFEIPETPEPTDVPDPTDATDSEDDPNSETKAGMTARLAAGLPKQFTDAQQSIETLGDAALAENNGALPIPVELIRNAIRSATSPEDLSERLALLVDAQSVEFADLLTRAQFAAEVLGYIAAEERVS